MTTPVRRGSWEGRRKLPLPMLIVVAAALCALPLRDSMLQARAAGAAAPARSDSARAYEQRVKEILGVQAPCRLAWISGYWDGGSIGGTLIGSDGRSLKFYWDGAMRPPSAYSSGPRPRFVFIGANNPSDPGAHPLAPWSRAESTLVAVLQDCSDRAIPRGDQKRLYDTYFDYSKPPDERAKLEPTEDILNALFVLRVIHFLGDRDAAGIWRHEGRWR